MGKQVGKSEGQDKGKGKGEDKGKNGKPRSIYQEILVERISQMGPWDWNKFHDRHGKGISIRVHPSPRQRSMFFQVMRPAVL